MKARAESKPPAKPGAPDPMAMLTPKGLGMRVGLPVLGVWVVAILITRLWAFAAAGAITIAAAALIIWALRFAKKSRDVANLVQAADTPAARKEALAKLETGYKKGDTAAVFARAQILLQEDPRQALAALEEIDLGRVMAPIADEARAQRAMIHLLLGEADRARPLADGIDLSRHQQARTRATLATVIGEAWARTGHAKKALDTLAVFDPNDAEYAELKPQLYRALAFAHASVNDTKAMKRDLKKLLDINPQLLAGFIQKKVHPLLQREAGQMLKQSGAVPRKMIVKRV